MNYKTAGVDVNRGDRFVESIAQLAARSEVPGVVSKIGHFAGMFDIQVKRFRHPILVGCTDGVGTKLKLAFEMNRHETIGIDLVAMNVNDLLVTGAEPLFFLDYLATGRLEMETHLSVIQGIVEGCRIAGCALLGGETAEMPGMYAKGEYDLAGFAVGVVEKSRIKNPQNSKAGDILIGLPSTGIHSNGYSLVRRVFQDRKRFPLNLPAGNLNRPLGDVLLEPTRIYRAETEVILEIPGVKAMAHITGEGIPGNLPRALPEDLGAELITGSWPVPAVFDLIASEGPICQKEMYDVFNMGLGLIAVCSPRSADRLINSLGRKGFESFEIGRVVKDAGVHFVSGSVRKQKRKSVPERVRSLKRIAVMGSGRGSNMQAICDAVRRGELDAEIACVISNNSKAFILERARRLSIPAFHVSATKAGPHYEEELLGILKHHRIDLICLAGYMKKIPPGIVSQFRNRIVNIHPALLPAFGGEGMYGMKVHSAVIASGARFSGATVHWVDDQYDTGRIIDQQIVPVLPEDTPETLASRVLEIEHDLYPRAVARLLEVDTAVG